MMRNSSQLSSSEDHLWRIAASALAGGRRACSASVATVRAGLGAFSTEIRLRSRMKLPGGQGSPLLVAYLKIFLQKIKAFIP